MKKINIVTAAVIAAGLAPHSGFAQDIGAAGQVAKGTTSGISLDRITDAAGPAASPANPQTPPPGGSKTVAPGPAATANTQISGTSSTTTLPFPAFTPAEYKQAAKDIVLINAAFAGETWNVRDAIAKGANVNSADWQYGFTPLMWASLKGHLGTVRYLLKHGAKVDTRSREGVSLVIAYNSNVLLPGQKVDSIVTAMWSNGSRAEALRGGVTALMVAAAHGYNLTVTELLASKAKVNLSAAAGETALMYAAYSGNLPTMKNLLAHGADVNAYDAMNLTALIYALTNNKKPAARLLLSKKIRTDLPDPFFHKPTSLLAKGLGMPDIARLIEKNEKNKPKPEVHKTPVVVGDNVIILN